jgi:hypothetical protein
MPTKITSRAQTQRARTPKVERVYTFFDKAEKNGLHFTLQDICKNSGYTQNTAKIYISKKWHWFLHTDAQGRYYCAGLHQFSKAQFITLHSQKRDPFVAQVTPPQTAHEERTEAMSIFSLDQQLEQLRTEFTQKLDALERSIAEGRAESASSTQALGQTLTGTIQGLPVPLEQTFATRIQALEQSIAAERDQTRSEWTTRMQVMEDTLLEKIQQLSPPSDFSQIRTEFTDALKTLEQTLLREIQQLHVSSEIS